MNYCLNCGAKVKPGASFCRSCGANLPLEENNNLLKNLKQKIQELGESL